MKNKDTFYLYILFKYILFNNFKDIKLNVRNKEGFFI